MDDPVVPFGVEHAGVSFQRPARIRLSVRKDRPRDDDRSAARSPLRRPSSPHRYRSGVRSRSAHSGRRGSGRARDPLQPGTTGLPPSPPHRGGRQARARQGAHDVLRSPGIPELRAAVANSVGERNGLDIDPNRVVVYPGGRPPIGFAHMAYSEAGEEVIYPSPGYPLFESFIPYFKCTPVRSSCAKRRASA